MHVLLSVCVHASDLGFCAEWGHVSPPPPPSHPMQEKFTIHYAQCLFDMFHPSCPRAWQRFVEVSASRHHHKKEVASEFEILAQKMVRLSSEAPISPLPPYPPPLPPLNSCLSALLFMGRATLVHLIGGDSWTVLCHSRNFEAV